MKLILSIYGWLLPVIVPAQDTKGLSGNLVPASGLPDTSVIKSVNNKPSILSGGFIDFIQTGQVNASARLFKIFIGERGKFRVPVSIYTGVSENNFSREKSENSIVSAFINPVSGIFNMYADGINKIAGGENKITSLQLQYHSGIRFLNIYNRLTYENYNFLNFLSGLGLTFVTGAWDSAKSDVQGHFWFNLRTLYSATSSQGLKNFFSGEILFNMLGYSAGMGIELSQVLDLKLFYFRHLSNQHAEAFTTPFLQLTFNYSTK